MMCGHCLFDGQHDAGFVLDPLPVVEDAPVPLTRIIRLTDHHPVAAVGGDVGAVVPGAAPFSANTLISSLVSSLD